jgi:hypothetical protein
LFGILSLILIGSGLSFMTMFFVYEMKVRGSSGRGGAMGKGRGGEGNGEGGSD